MLKSSLLLFSFCILAPATGVSPANQVGAIRNKRENRLWRRQSLSFLPDDDDKPSFEPVTVGEDLQAFIEDVNPPTRARSFSFYEASSPKPAVVVSEMHIKNQLKNIVQEYSNESLNSEYSYTNRVKRFIALSGVASPRVEAYSPRLFNQAYAEAMNFVRIALLSGSSKEVDYSRQIKSFFAWLLTRFSPMHVSRIASRCLHTLQNGL